MKQRLILTFFFLFVSFYSFPAEIILKGVYYGLNLYVNNPSVDKGFCVTKVLVNGIQTNDEIQSNAFEIDFSLLELKNGDPVTVKIIHKDNCTPAVINPKVLEISEAVSMVYAKVDRTGKLIWGMTGEMPDDVFIIEQFRWNKWINIAEVSTADSIKKNAYAFDIVPHSGINQYRILRTDINDNPVYSKIIKYTSRTPELTLESARVSDKLVFSAESQYEIFDMKGNFLSEGFGKEVDVSELEKGKYWVNFDNKSLNFTRK